MSNNDIIDDEIAYFNSLVNDCIHLGVFTYNDRNYKDLECILIVERESVIPDLKVFCNDSVQKHELYNSDEFNNAIFKYLKSTGYNGGKFDRAELGLQGLTYMTFEPYPDSRFEEWITKLGWINDFETDLNYLI